MLHKALKILRTYHQFSQIALARRLEIANSYLSEIESGHKSIKIELLEKYAEIFKIPISSIFFFSEAMQEKKTKHNSASNLRIAAADKILHLLECVREQNSVTSNDNRTVSGIAESKINAL